MENSRAAKFLFDRDAKENGILTSTNWCVSPLVQSGWKSPAV